MQRRNANAGAVFFFLAVLGLSVLESEAHSAPAPKPAQPEKKEAPKTVKFVMKDKPWKAVFEWLSDTTGKPVITTFTPTGTCTFVGQADKEYTIPQVIDILNEALLSNSQTQKYYLIIRERSFTLVPAYEEIEPVRLPRVKREDLVKYAAIQRVSLVLPLAKLDAEKMAMIANVMMWPSGTCVPLTSPGINRLILIDRAGKLKRICPLLMMLDKVDPFPHFPRLLR